MSEAREQLATRLRFQADACERLGSPLYAELLGAAAREVVEGELLYGVLRGHEDDPAESLLPLRLMGAVHRLVLRGDAPELAAHYPSAGGEPHHPWPAFAATLDAHAVELRQRVDDPVQTNEPARCAALLGGFLEVARLTGLPLRLLEAGASAGLNLRFDHYRYLIGDRTWGPASSAVTIRSAAVGQPPLEGTLSVASRAGCDARPVDPTTSEGQLTLSSYAWPDQLERFARLRAAYGVAAEVHAGVVRAGAEQWTREQLAAPEQGAATVVFHSIVMQYLSAEERAGFEECVSEAGAGASAQAPLAWLRMEPGAGLMTDVRLTIWPGGRERVLARAGYHGDRVEWLG